MGLPWLLAVWSLLGLTVNGAVSPVPSVQAHGDDKGACHYELKVPIAACQECKCPEDVATDVVDEIKDRLATIEKQIEQLMASMLPPEYEVSDYPMPSFSSIIEVDPSIRPVDSTAYLPDQSSLPSVKTDSPPGVREAHAEESSPETGNQGQAEVMSGFVGSSPGTKNQLEAAPWSEQIAADIEIAPILKPLNDDANNLPKVEAAPELENPASKDKDLDRGPGDEEDATPAMPPYEQDTPRNEDTEEPPWNGVFSGRAAASSLASTTGPEKLEKEQVMASGEPLVGGEDGNNKPRWRLHQDEDTKTENSEQRSPFHGPLGRSGNICMDGCSCLRLWGYWQDGVYAVGNPPGSGKKGDEVLVYCDMTTDGGAWTVIQNRMDGSRNFYRDWSSYANGFGRLDSDFWLGNNILHGMTARLHYQLRVEFTDWDKQEGFAVYDGFAVGSKLQKYRLTLAKFVDGDRGDALSYHNNSYFSTHDRDNDESARENCAQLRQAGFWFRACNRANPNGRYVRGPEASGLNGGVITWGTWESHGYNYALKSFRMMIRPVDYRNILYL